MFKTKIVTFLVVTMYINQSQGQQYIGTISAQHLLIQFLSQAALSTAQKYYDG